MKKMTKLLSVILAFVMALSCMTMMASAAKASYKTVADLDGLNAYSPYGTVTRLTSEERLSILLDSLDILLTKVNINMGWQGLSLGFIKIQVLIDFRNVDQALASLDSFYDKKGYFSLIGGTIGKLNMDNWQKNMSRKDTAQMVILNNILRLLSDNTSLVGDVLDNGISLGLLKSFVKVDLSGINGLVKDLPGAIKSLAFSMMSRPDDLKAMRDKLSDKKNSDLLDIAQEFVNGLFTKPMNWTSYREDASGKDLGYTLSLPKQEDGKSRYFVYSEDADGKHYTQYDYQYAGLMGDPVGGEWVETVVYTRDKEFDSDSCTTYVYRAPEGYDGDQTLKWYKADGKTDADGRIQSSHWLHSIKDKVGTDLTININGADSLLGLLYKFAPYLFAEMAPIVLNGSAKKLIAEAFDVEFTKIGSLVSTNADNTAFAPDEDLQAVISEVGDPENFFTKAQEYYIWEYTDYKVIEGTPYYRYQNTYFKGEIPENISVFYDMINWNWKVEGNFFDEFIPKTVGSTWALDSLNDVIGKAIKTMIADTWNVRGQEYTREDVFNWAEGDNSKLLKNFMDCARKLFSIAPEEIVDEFASEAQFYEQMMNGEDIKPAFNGLVMELVKLIMPQIKFADNLVNQPMTAIAAVVVRELCTQLMPTYDFDAMIFANYGNTANKDRAVLEGKSADYWLDTTLYMGVNLGMYYLRNIADVGEDSELGYYAVMKTLKAIPSSATADKMEFTATSQYVGGTVDSKNASWLYMVDWIVDWALDTDTEWCWHFGRLVDAGTVELATYQNPFEKINSVILTFIPELKNLLNTDGLKGDTYGSNTWLEQILKGGLVDSIVDLNVPQLIGMLHIPEASVLRSEKIADTLVQLIVTLLNSITKKVCGGANLINASTITSVASLLNQTNIKGVVTSLIGKLYNASNTYKVLDPILPIANFFIGWTTDPQKYVDPFSVYDNSGVGDNNAPIPDYFCTRGTETITITNQASGMLLRHRDKDGKLTSADSAYTITIKSIASDDGTISCSRKDVEIGPGMSESFTIGTGVTTSRMARIIITYTLTGKDGHPIGGTRTAESYVVVSDNYHPGDYAKTLENKTTVLGISYVYINAGWSIAGRDGIVITSGNPEDIQTEVENLYFDIVNWRDKALNITKKVYTPGTQNIVANTENINSVTSVDAKPKDGDDPHVTCNFAKLADGVDVNTIKSGTVWGLGSFALEVAASDNTGKKDSDTKSLGYLYYADLSKLENLFEEEINNNRNPGDYTDATFNAYVAAMKEIGAYISPRLIKDNGPEYFAANYTDAKIKEKLDSFRKAINGLKKKESASGGIEALEKKLGELETNPNRDINFQDYNLFEYFKYENERTATRNIIKSVTGPSAPESYIANGVWGDKIIADIKAAQKDHVAKGIEKTVTHVTPAEQEAYEIAAAEFVPASYSDLELENQKVMLEYYYNFMIANKKTNTSKTFLEREIAYADGQQYDESIYSHDSWSRYDAAIKNAKAVQAKSGATESEIFDAKYELMVAENKLQLKERSMKDTGYMNEELIPLIQHAQAIIDLYEEGVYAPIADVNADDAFAALVKALGIPYDADGDGKYDVEKDAILYDRSARTFEAYDRTATVKNKKAVDAASEKLREAIELFECTVKVEGADETTNVDDSINYITGIDPNTVFSAEAMLEKVTVQGGTPVVTASKAGKYGTGTRIDIMRGENLLVSYFVVIFGDVNGDGAVDGFDALELDVANNKYAHHMGDIYDDAADVNHDGVVDEKDYAALVNGVKCAGTIQQVG